METADLAAVRDEGRKAFLQAGVTAARGNSYPVDSKEYSLFAEGCRKEQFDAGWRALDDELAYHQLTVREGEKDRV